MPHSTARYLFEFKLHEWAQSHQGGSGFFLVLDGAGTVVRSEVGDPLVDRFLVNELKAREASWLFYDPFEPNEYAWLDWQAVSRPALEALTGETFEPEDFLSPLGPLEEFPGTWGVMF